MNRRQFCATVAGIAAAATLPIAAAPVQPRIARGDRLCEWRGYDWWIDERHCLRWSLQGEAAKDLDFIAMHGDDAFAAIATGVEDKLWILSRNYYWYTFEFAVRPTDDTARIRCVKKAC